MKQIVIIVSFLLCCSILTGSAFEEFVRDAGQRMAGNLDPENPLTVVIDRTESGNPKPNESSKMYEFISELLSGELGRSGTMIFVDKSKTDPILKSLAKMKRDYRFYDQLGSLVFNETNVIPDALLECKITDLDTIVKVELILIEARTVSELVTVVREYPADEQTNRLLGKEINQMEIHPEPDQVSGVSVQEIEQKETDDTVVFSEDFSAYMEGDPLPDWGKGIVVLKNAEGKKYVGSQIGGKHVLEKQLLFPNPLLMSYTFSRPVENPSLILIDSSNTEIRVTLSNNWRGPLVTISGSESRKFACEDFNTLQISREGATFKVYINGDYMLSGYYEDLGDIIGFKLELHQGQLYTDFTIEKI